MLRHFFVEFLVATNDASRMTQDLEEAGPKFFNRIFKWVNVFCELAGRAVLDFGRHAGLSKTLVAFLMTPFAAEGIRSGGVR